MIYETRKRSSLTRKFWGDIKDTHLLQIASLLASIHYPHGSWRPHPRTYFPLPGVKAYPFLTPLLYRQLASSVSSSGFSCSVPPYLTCHGPLRLRDGWAMVVYLMIATVITLQQSPQMNVFSFSIGTGLACVQRRKMSPASVLFSSSSQTKKCPSL